VQYSEKSLIAVGISEFYQKCPPQSITAHTHFNGYCEVFIDTTTEKLGHLGKTDRTKNVIKST
jgi:hypothetical protein